MTIHSAGRAAIIAAAALVAGAALAVRRSSRVGATRNEAAHMLPGDELLDATVQNDRAVTVPAPPEKVWPWIAQLGQNKAGFYSFERLENLAGCEITNAKTIRPEWQDVKVGDPFPLAPGLGLRVALVAPGDHLVLTSEGGEHPDPDIDFDATWGFHLTATDVANCPGTRLHIRERYAASNRRTALMLDITGIISAVMTWKMMRTIRYLATAS
ncbi:hypothetical protein [Flaviflexus huanghaiensis]|uniref:hypothetical protein n=1 Tax=Flaviflexus huanghaiensis TaxID=1111473 RepID=UPI0015F8F71C|nr:hypothetical protein [Flaviflexus huanghaiensis]